MHPLVVHDIVPLSEREAEVYVASTCFKTGPPTSLGLEIERLVYDDEDPRLPVPATRVSQAVEAAGRELPGGGLISLEPGGQLELSSLRAGDLAQLIRATRSDLSAIDRRLRANGLRAGAEALDATRPLHRSLNHPRYAAMEQYFDRSGPTGRTMMCGTAAIQVCVDAGLDGAGRGSAIDRWRRLHRLAPVLVAMFANSPFHNGAPNGWRSNRQRVWLTLDPPRTRAPSPDGDPRQSWAEYALAAPLLCLINPGGSWAAPAGLTMRSWLRGEGPRPATQRDLDYHLTTLFPPVRPRGFLELRVIDAQAGSTWEVAVAMVTALVEDERASEQAYDACTAVGRLADPMLVAARDALSSAVLADAAEACADAAMTALRGLGADKATRSRVASFVDRHTARRRCPADERLDRWDRTGRLDPLGEMEER